MYWMIIGGIWDKEKMIISNIEKEYELWLFDLNGKTDKVIVYPSKKQALKTIKENEELYKQIYSCIQLYEVERKLYSN